jgi:CubicO group peptidase (beta-lactamase class C family)
VYARGFGVRDLAGRAPVGAQTRFEIGSDTKQFTAAAILQLWERGELSLDDRLATYVPAFPHARTPDRSCLRRRCARRGRGRRARSCRRSATSRSGDAALRSGKIVSAADFALMTAPATLSDGKVDEYGFGWWTDPFRGHRHIYHDGDTFGMSSSNNLYPDDDLTIIVLENIGQDTAARTAAAIFETLVPLVAPARG